MPLSVREATLSDLEEVVQLLVEDARRREATNKTLWRLDADAHGKTAATIKAAMEQEKPPVRQQWLLAEASGRPVGITHSILLPVPGIYAGEFGPPGLIMEGSFVAEDAPAGTAQALLEATEADLRRAGAVVLVASSVPGGAWGAVFRANGYYPLTLYLAKTGLRPLERLDGVRPATADDVADIVSSSAENRQILFSFNDFWKPHAEADERFGLWMNKSLALEDRDMFVSRADGVLTGYAISQPATALHFPAPHDISKIGKVDDFFHRDIDDPRVLKCDGAGISLFGVAEAALRARGNEASLVVCPAAWMSKIAFLEAAGYANAITWFRKRAN